VGYEGYRPISAISAQEPFLTLTAIIHRYSVALVYALNNAVRLRHPELLEEMRKQP
jgi:hypothetical protein